MNDFQAPSVNLEKHLLVSWKMLQLTNDIWEERIFLPWFLLMLTVFSLRILVMYHYYIFSGPDAPGPFLSSIQSSFFTVKFQIVYHSICLADLRMSQNFKCRGLDLEVQIQKDVSVSIFTWYWKQIIETQISLVGVLDQFDRNRGTMLLKCFFYICIRDSTQTVDIFWISRENK